MRLHRECTDCCYRHSELLCHLSLWYKLELDLTHDVNLLREAQMAPASLLSVARSCLPNELVRVEGIEVLLQSGAAVSNLVAQLAGIMQAILQKVLRE